MLDAIGIPLFRFLSYLPENIATFRNVKLMHLESF